MSTMISVPSEHGEIMIEVDGPDPSRALTRGGGGGPLEKATATFEDGWAQVKPIAAQIIGQLSDVIEGTEQVKVSFGVKFSAGAGVFIASASTEANFAVEVTWKKPQPSG